MTAILLRVLIYAAIAGFVYFGVRRIWRDFTGQFQPGNAPPRPTTTDIKERQRADVIDLKRDADGVFRPPDKRS